MTPPLRGYLVAPLGKRFLAWFVDLVGLLIAMSILALALNLGENVNTTYIAPDGHVATNVRYIVDGVATESILAILSALYCIPLWVYGNGTLAQRALGLRIFEANGPRRVGLGRAIARWLALFGWTFLGIASAYNQYEWLIDLAAITWFLSLLVTTRRDPQRRGIHDRLGRSIVVALSPQWEGGQSSRVDRSFP